MAKFQKPNPNLGWIKELAKPVQKPAVKEGFTWSKAVTAEKVDKIALPTPQMNKQTGLKPGDSNFVAEKKTHDIKRQGK